MKVNEGEVPQYYVSGNHEPVSEFCPSQWSALIDYVIVDEDTIRFVFRVGEEVSIQL